MVIRSRVSVREPATGVVGAAGEAAPDTAEPSRRAAGGAAARNTSCLVTRGPLAGTDSICTSCARATFRAVGVARTSSGTGAGWCGRVLSGAVGVVMLSDSILDAGRITASGRIRKLQRRTKKAMGCDKS